MWLHAVPKGDIDPRINYVEHNLPDISRFEDILSHLANLGWSDSSGMKATAVSWQEIESYQRQLGINLNAWEVETVIYLSGVHAHWSGLASDPTCLAPDTLEDDADRIARIDAKIRG